MRKLIQCVCSYKMGIKLEFLNIKFTLWKQFEVRNRAFFLFLNFRIVGGGVQTGSARHVGFFYIYIVGIQFLWWRFWYSLFLFCWSRFVSCCFLLVLVGWGTMLQDGRPRIRILIRSLNFSIELILLAATLWPWVRPASDRNEYQKSSWS
jgi:hypothetical protein